MNKKTKRITVGLVAVLCFLLVFALGFGLTGAWYQANRRASGTVQMDQGIKLYFTGLETLVNNDLQSKLEGKILEDLDVDVPLNKSIAPAANIKLVNPTIKGASDTSDFYVKVKLTYQYRLYEEGETVIDENGPLYTAEQLGLNEEELYATQVGISTTGFVVSGNWSVYGTAADLAGLTKVNASTTPISILNGTSLEFNDWTEAGNVERGGPVIESGTYEGREVAQVVLTLDIMTIQADNLTETALTAWLRADIA